MVGDLVKACYTSVHLRSTSVHLRSTSVHLRYTSVHLRSTVCRVVVVLFPALDLVDARLWYQGVAHVRIRRNRTVEGQLLLRCLEAATDDVAQETQPLVPAELCPSRHRAGTRRDFRLAVVLRLLDQAGRSLRGVASAELSGPASVAADGSEGAAEERVQLRGQVELVVGEREEPVLDERGLPVSIAPDADVDPHQRRLHVGGVPGSSTDGAVPLEDLHAAAHGPVQAVEQQAQRVEVR
eukprot:CAMPEP_0196760000 /NCGR_PEP_ID=MMETSP1091-20130531/104990_1 /TAXON_ID=302021 /ORGANISM="Rhodomonas sp., Strain CCMP768" /LENGTH=238 /DNA_ID=CAMNT_0042108865 /DNA_START=427 /DNA_END=1140 /DNA_ORIENTATION=-